MECKETRVYVSVVRKFVLIETLWNVKDYPAADNPECPSVLIETLWNVKIETAKNEALRASVLIETLWNVKLEEDDEEFCSSSY